MQTIFLIICILCVCSAVATTLWRTAVAVVLAYMALWAGHLSAEATFSTTFFISWGVVAVICLILDLYSEPIPKSANMVRVYVLLGAIAGAMVGLTVADSCLIPGCALGAFVALLAFSKTPRGGGMPITVSTIVQVFCRYALTTVAIISMLATLIGAIVRKSAAETLLNM